MWRRIPAIGWAVGLSLLALLWAFLAFDGGVIPRSVDVNVGNFRAWQFVFPPTGQFSTDYWLGLGGGSPPPQPLSLAAHLPAEVFFTWWYPAWAAIGILMTYGFLRELRLARLVAVFGGVMCGWQGPLLTNIHSGHFVPAPQLAAAVGALWGAYRAVRTGNWLAAAAAGVCVGLVVQLQPDVGGLLALLVGCFALFLIGRRFWVGERAQVARGLGQLVFLVVVSAVLGWPVLSGTFRQTAVDAKPAVPENREERYAWATQWSLPPGETMVYLVPGFFGWKTGDVGGPYWGEVGRTVGWEQNKQGMRNFQLDHQSFGTVAFLLCLLGGFALVRWRALGRAAPGWTAEQRAIGMFALVGAVGCLLLSFGRHAPFYRLFFELPYMDAWRNPIKFRVPGHLCMVTMAAMGLDWLRHLVAGGESLAGPRKRVRDFLLVVAGGIGAGFLLLGDFGSEGSGDLRPQGFGDAEIETIRAVAQSSLGVAVAVALALAAALHLTGKKFAESGGGEKGAAMPDRLCAVACALTALQMLWVTSHYVEPFRFREYLAGNAALVRVLKPDGPPTRVKLFNQDPALNDLLTTLLPYHEIPSIDIPAASRVMQDYDAFFKALGNNPMRLWHLAGVRFVLAPAQFVPQLQQGIPGFAGNIARAFGFRATGGPEIGAVLSSTGQGEPVSHAAIEMREYLPKATVFGKVEVLDSPDAVLGRLAAADWQPAASVLLDKASAERVGIGAGTAFADGGTAVVRRYGKRLIEIATTTRDGGVLMINDRFDANWSATVNGKLAPIVPADFIMRGIVVPPGEAMVVMRYAAPAGGVWLCIVVWLGLLAWWIACRVRPNCSQTGRR